MARFVRFFCFVTSLIFLATSTAVQAANTAPLTPDQIKVRLIKQGVDKPIWFEDRNGLRLRGRLITFGDNSFNVQLAHSDYVSTFNYTDIVDLNGRSTRAFWIFAGVSAGAVATAGIVGYMHVHHAADQNSAAFMAQCQQNFPASQCQVP